MTPQKQREIILQICYSLEHSNGEDSKELIDLLSKESKVTKKNVRDCITFGVELQQKLSEIDAILAPCLRSYTIERLHGMDRAIMRLAIFEFYFKKSISANIAISEAIRLAKKFSTPEAGAFINGVLDAALSKGKAE